MWGKTTYNSEDRLIKSWSLLQIRTEPYPVIPRRLTNWETWSPARLDWKRKEALTSRAASRRSMYSMRWCCCPRRGPDHDKRSKTRRGAQGPMAAGQQGHSRSGQSCAGASPAEARGLALEAGWGRGLPPFWIAGRSHCSGMLSGPSQAPPPPFRQD